MDINQKIAQLGTSAECEALLQIMTDDKSNAETDVSVLDQKSKDIQKVGAESKIKFNKSSNELNVLTAITAAADEETRKEYEEDLKSLDLKVLRLTKKLKNYGDVAAIEVAFDIKIKQMIIAEIESIITAAQSRKTELDAPPTT
jgi:VIT1/CCC1 family predicted Fe2+/Mn2+ transporter